MSKIAIVDDSKTDRAAIMKALEKTGHSFVEFASGAECLQCVKNIRPDLIILDIIMPETDGYQVCRQIKRDADVAKIPIIMLTSKTGPADKVWGMKQGAEIFLTKPFDEAELRSSVAKLLGGA